MREIQILLLNKEGIIVSLNSTKYSKTLEVPSKDLSIGADYIKAWETFNESPEKSRLILSFLHEVINGKKRSESEYCLEISHKKKWFTISIAPWEDHRIAHAIITISEVTEKKVVEANSLAILNSKSAEEKNILDFSLDIICILDQEGRFKQISKASKKIWGYAPHELIGKKYLDFMHPEDQEKTIRENIKITSGDSTMNFGNRYLHKDGSIIHMMWSAYWSTEKKSMYCIARDMTEVLQIESLLQEQEKKFRVMIEKNFDMIYMKDEDGKITYASPSIERILGYKAEELCRNAYTDYIHEEDLKASEEVLSKLKQAPGNTQTFQRRMKCKNGEWIWIEGSITNLLNEPIVHALICNFRDISERKSMELKLDKLYSDLDHKAQSLKNSNTELERFAYVASHDLQEPLRMISSFLTLLERKYKDQLDEQAGKYIYFAKDGSERMKRLIEDLLDYSRVDRIKEDFQKIDIGEVMQEMANLYEIPLKETNTSLQIHNLPTIIGIKSQIRQLFQNILGNAIKYRNTKGEKPRIVVSFSESSSHWIFSIEDNGIGIESQFLNKVFILFQRLHTRNEYSGTGIGLAISKKIAEKHKGTMWVESAEGKGSQFFFSISKNL